MKTSDVHALVQNGRVLKAPHYHAGKRGLSFLDILAALERCYHVARDERTDAEGSPLHPRGWYALANLPHRRQLRIEFEVQQDDEGNLLLIVTAYYV